LGPMVRYFDYHDTLSGKMFSVYTFNISLNFYRT
jgi:hypothetical protein